MDLFKKAVEMQISENLKSIKELNSMPNPVWIEPYPIAGRSSVPLTYMLSGKQIWKTGVYKIFHWNNFDTPMVIGQGNIVDRQQKHRLIFRNKGSSVIYSGGSSSGCQTATKMYQYDTDIDNWYLSWCELPKNIMEKYEAILIKELKPKFNADFMAGL